MKLFKEGCVLEQKKRNLFFLTLGKHYASVVQVLLSLQLKVKLLSDLKGVSCFEIPFWDQKCGN